MISLYFVFYLISCTQVYISNCNSFCVLCFVTILWRFHDCSTETLKICLCVIFFNESLMIFRFMRKRSGVFFYQGGHTFMLSIKNDQFYDVHHLSGELVLPMFKKLILALHYISVVLKILQLFLRLRETHNILQLPAFFSFFS